MIPGSAMRKLEAQTGLVVEKASDACYRINIAPSVALFAFVKDEKESCRILRDMNWKRVCGLVFAKQEWKCAECQKMTGLQGHHVKFKSRWRRSDGPLDVESNVRGLCQNCHSSEHGIS